MVLEKLATGLKDGELLEILAVLQKTQKALKGVKGSAGVQVARYGNTAGEVSDATTQERKKVFKVLIVDLLTEVRKIRKTYGIDG